jgi:hypothetical protein
MCEVFLEIRWIDKSKKIGYATYEAILSRKKAKFDGERRKVSALVIMDDIPEIDIDVRKYKSQGRLNELSDAVVNGKVTRWPNTRIEYKDKVYDLYSSNVVDGAIENYPLLSDHRQTVCVVYPDELRAWIIEGKSVKHTYTETQLQDLSKRIVETQTRVSPEEVETPDGVIGGDKYVVPPEKVERFAGFLWVLDINHDGRDDYIGSRSASFIEYSWSDMLYQVRNGYGKTGSQTHSILIFPPTNRLCHILPPMGMGILTTDGKNYYLDNQCNLTELTSPAIR